jgi:hypothetical protein
MTFRSCVWEERWNLNLYRYAVWCKSRVICMDSGAFMMEAFYMFLFNDKGMDF